MVAASLYDAPFVRFSWNKSGWDTAGAHTTLGLGFTTCQVSINTQETLAADISAAEGNLTGGG